MYKDIYCSVFNNKTPGNFKLSEVVIKIISRSDYIETGTGLKINSKPMAYSVSWGFPA